MRFMRSFGSVEWTGAAGTTTRGALTAAFMGVWKRSASQSRDGCVAKRGKGATLHNQQGRWPEREWKGCQTLSSGWGADRMGAAPGPTHRTRGVRRETQRQRSASLSKRIGFWIPSGPRAAHQGRLPEEWSSTAIWRSVEPDFRGSTPPFADALRFRCCPKQLSPVASAAAGPSGQRATGEGRKGNASMKRSERNYEHPTSRAAGVSGLGVRPKNFPGPAAYPQPSAWPPW